MACDRQYIFLKNWAEIVGIIDEKRHVIGLVAAMQVGRRPPRRLYCRRRKQPEILHGRLFQT